MIKFTGDLRCDFEKAAAEIEKQKDRILGYQEKIAGLRESVNKLKKSKEKDKKQYQVSLAEKSSLKEPEESDVTDTFGHPLQDDECCPKCGLVDCTPTGESEIKYEYDVRIKVVKIKHEFFCYKRNNCGTVFRSQIPPVLKEKVQYGSELQTLALSLTNTVNASMNKASMFLAGITGGELTPCEGYVAKLQVRAAKGLQRFRADLKLLLITRKIIYWDDTVIMILTKRACFRFYGDETIAYYTAHAHKDMESLDDDNVLNLLTGDTKTMQDVVRRIRWWFIRHIIWWRFLPWHMRSSNYMMFFRHFIRMQQSHPSDYLRDGTENQ